LPAGSDDREVREAGIEAELRFDQLADGVEVLDGHRRHGRALLAVEVLARLASGEDVEPGAVGEMDVANDAEALEQLEVAIDRGRVDRELARELVRGHRPVGGEQ